MLSIRRPIGATEAAVRIGFIELLHLLSIWAHHPHLVPSDLVRLRCERHPRPISRNGIREGVIANLARRPTHDRDSPNTRALSGYHRVGYEAGALVGPGGDNAPIHLNSVEIGGLRNVPCLTRFNYLAMHPFRVGVCKVIAVR